MEAGRDDDDRWCSDRCYMKFYGELIYMFVHAPRIH